MPIKESFCDVLKDASNDLPPLYASLLPVFNSTSAIDVSASLDPPLFSTLPVGMASRRHARGANNLNRKRVLRHWATFPLSANFSEVELAAMRQHFGVQISLRNCTLPLSLLPFARCWEEMTILAGTRCGDEREGLSTSESAALTAKYAVPTPIQQQVIPLATAPWSSFKSGALDVVAVAPTGSGKTLCYAVACVCVARRCGKRESGGTPVALVISPTRELALQARAVTKGLSPTTRVEAVVGGVEASQLHETLSKGVDVVLGTPGQLLAQLNICALSLKSTRLVCIDEVDRMMEPSMAQQLGDMLENCRSPRQTLVFTATLRPHIANSVARYMSPEGYVTVLVQSQTNNLVQQWEPFFQKEGDDGTNFGQHSVATMRLRRLRSLILGNKPPIVVFVDEKSATETVCSQIHKFDFDDCAQRNVFESAISLHADLSQEERVKRVECIHSGKTAVVVASDLAGRGMDISSVSLVVNLCESGRALTSEQYTHRIGRTGRAGRLGIAVTFVTVPDGLLEESQRNGAYTMKKRKRAEAEPAPEQYKEVSRWHELWRTLRGLVAVHPPVDHPELSIDHVGKLIVPSSLRHAMQIAAGAVMDAAEEL